MALVRTLKVLVKLPGNKTQTIRETVPADWIAGDKDAMSELLQNQKIRTKIVVVPEHVISVQISDPWDPSQAGAIVLG